MTFHTLTLVVAQLTVNRSRPVAQGSDRITYCSQIENSRNSPGGRLSGCLRKQRTESSRDDSVAGIHHRAGHRTLPAPVSRPRHQQVASRSHHGEDTGPYRCACLGDCYRGPGVARQRERGRPCQRKGQSNIAVPGRQRHICRPSHRRRLRLPARPDRHLSGIVWPAAGLGLRSGTNTAPCITIADPFGSCFASAGHGRLVLSAQQRGNLLRAR
jgi:hypothetical protein